MRRFHAYTIGVPRSGSHSISNMFETSFHCAHEPWAEETIKLVLANGQGELNSTQLREHLLRRDSAAKFEMEATHFMHFFVSELVDLFPHSKYVLTVRDPMQWIQSVINQNIVTSQPRFAIWQTLEAYTYGRYGFDTPKPERKLGAIPNVWPLAAYFKNWAEHNQTVLNAVPKSRLMLLETADIQNFAGTLCKFLGSEINPGLLNMSKSHSGQGNDNLEAVAEKRIDVFSYVDVSYVNAIIDEYCQPVIDRLRAFFCTG